jgi:hypothetical protein
MRDNKSYHFSPREVPNTAEFLFANAPEDELRQALVEHGLGPKAAIPVL